VKLSRPGWWLVTIWLYLAPTGGRYDLLTSLPFWCGLVYALFPLNLLVYGLNDYTDIAIDAANDRKGNFMYGAKCTPEQLRSLPQIIVVFMVGGATGLALLTGKYVEMVQWLVLCFSVNLAYNIEPFRLSSKGPFELPCVVAGFAGCTWLGIIVNDVPTCSTGYWAHLTCLVLRTQIWTELLDYAPDAACGRRTTSTLVGERASQVLVVLLLLMEVLVTFYFFDDWLMRLFSVLGLVVFIGLELVKGTSDREKKTAMKMQNAVGLSLVLWIWHKAIFAGR